MPASLYEQQEATRAAPKRLAAAEGARKAKRNARMAAQQVGRQIKGARALVGWLRPGVGLVQPDLAMQLLLLPHLLVMRTGPAAAACAPKQVHVNRPLTKHMKLGHWRLTQHYQSTCASHILSLACNQWHRLMATRCCAACCSVLWFHSWHCALQQLGPHNMHTLQDLAPARDTPGYAAGTPVAAGQTARRHAMRQAGGGGASSSTTPDSGARPCNVGSKDWGFQLPPMQL